MQVKPYDPALTTNPASLRPSDVAQLTAQTQQLIEGLADATRADSVSLSAAVRGLNSALSRALPTLDPAGVAELLTASDRFVLVRALELVEHEKLDAQEVQHLLVDLARYRAAERTLAGAREQLDTKTTRALTDALPAARERGASPEPAQREQAAERTDQRLLLATFSARDEALARRILTSSALRETAIDPGFVRALVDPDRNPTHAVDFAFLRRLVVALSPSQSEGTDGKVSLGPRLARAQLAEAFARLELSARDLPAATREALAQGRTLLKQQLAQLSVAAPGKNANPLYALLRAGDRSMLGLLYAAAAQQRVDPRAIDDVARAVIDLRTAERAARSSTTGLPSRVPGAAMPEPPAASVRPRVASGTYTRASAIPSAFPAALAGDAALEPEPGQRLVAEHASSDSLLPPAPRSFGSASQLAARAAGSYRSLAPPPPAQLESATPPAAPGLGSLAASLSPEHALSAAANASQGSPLSRPLDLGQALGLGALIDQARARKKLPKRMKLPALDRSVHAVGPARAAPSEAEADDPLVGSTRRERRRVRWQLLIQRRRRARRQHR